MDHRSEPERTVDEAASDPLEAAVGRLHVRGRAAVDALTPTPDHVVIDRGEQVAEDAQAIRILRQRVPVVAIVNNHYAGYAPETARQLVALTG